MFFFINFLLWKTSVIFCLYNYLLCRRGNNYFDVHVRRIGPVFCLSKGGKTLSEKEEMDGEVFISRQSWHFPFINNMIKVLFPTFTVIWRVNNYVSRQGKCINTRNESTIIII